MRIGSTVRIEFRPWYTTKLGIRQYGYLRETGILCVKLGAGGSMARLYIAAQRLESHEPPVFRNLQDRVTVTVEDDRCTQVDSKL